MAFSIAVVLSHMHVELVRDFDRLESLAGEWDSIAGSLPFRSAAWLHAWWRHYGHNDPRRTLCTAIVWNDENRVAGIAPWYVDRGSFRGKVLKFLGNDEICTDYLGVMARPENVRGVASALAAFLGEFVRDQRREPAWDLVELDSAAAGDVPTEALWQELGGRGLPSETLDGRNNWRLTLPSTWDVYMEMLSRDWRKKFRKLRRKWLDSRVASHHVATRDTLERAWSILSELHQKRRQSLGEKGLFMSPRFTNFHREVVERLFPKGQVRLHWLEVRGKPIAIEYALLDQGVHYAYQSGIDPSFLEYDPGTTLFVAYVVEAIAQGEAAYDCMRGDEPYKAHWRAQPTRTSVYRLVSGGTSSWIRHRAWEWGRTARRLIRRGLAAAGMGQRFL